MNPDRELRDDYFSNRPTFEIPREKGIACLSGKIFPETMEVIRAAHQIKDNASQSQFKPFMRDLPLKNLSVESPFIRLALNPDLVCAVSQYLDVIPILYYISILVSRYVDDSLDSSQLFHCDPDDRRIASLFLYCSEVDEKSGPLTVIPSDTSKKIREELKYTYGGDRYRVSDKETEPYLADGEPVKIMGGPGTIGLVDTANCFHQGSRVEKGGNVRVVVVIRYLTPSAFFFPPRKGHYGCAQYRHLASRDDGKIDRLILGAE